MSPSQTSLNSSFGYFDDHSSYHGKNSESSTPKINQNQNQETRNSPSKKNDVLNTSMITNNSNNPLSESSKGSRKKKKKKNASKASKEVDSNQFEVVPEKIKEGGKTTLMIKNIANKCAKSMIKQLINRQFKDKYDFFYLPIDTSVAFLSFN